MPRLPRRALTVRKSDIATTRDWSSGSRLPDAIEFANAFSELNDPDDQRQRFEERVRHAAAGDENAPPFDTDYIFSLEH